VHDWCCSGNQRMALCKSDM